KCEYIHLCCLCEQQRYDSIKCGIYLGQGMSEQAIVSPSRQRSAKELLARRSARRSLADFCEYLGVTPARHHRYLLSKLQAVERGEIKRLMVFMPPGSAKSTYA